MAILIKGATLLSGRKADILVEGNLISKIRPFVSASGAERINASGKLLVPGFVNTHTHAAMSLLRGFAEDMQLYDWLAKVRQAEKKMKPSAVFAGALLACAEMLKSGTTCFCDMYFHMDSVAAAVARSGIRATLGYGMADMGEKKRCKQELRIGEKFVKAWHGRENGRIRCSIAPHSIYLCSAELLAQANGLSEKYGVPYHIHLSETRKEVFDCLLAHKKRPAYYLDSLGVLSCRTVAAHCTWLTKEEVRLLALRKASASLCPVSNMKLAGGGCAPMPEMEQFGMNVSLGTDGAASNNSLSMFETAKTLGLVQKNARWNAAVAKDSAIFSAATAGGARALGIAAGEIREGSLADIVLLDLKAANMAPYHSPVANVIYSANAGNVTDVIVDGRQVVEDGRLLVLDEEKIVQQARKEAQRLIS
ncbi:MAG: amidohydrolase [Candidatus Micrarchaeota archaeon]|nr:amidohydrolase [Candidatus Micrarchaeota archaeon]